MEPSGPQLAISAGLIRILTPWRGILKMQKVPEDPREPAAATTFSFPLGSMHELCEHMKDAKRFHASSVLDSIYQRIAIQ